MEKMKCVQTYPPLYKRLYGVWCRHYAVYTKNLYSNAFPPFMEPLIFLAAVGLGIGKFISGTVEGLQYIEFLATGLLMTSAMYTSAFECSYGTFIRLEFDKVYDGMLAAPITAENLIVGEIIWAGTKGLFFSFAVLVVMASFGVISSPYSAFTPIVGFATGIMFAVLSLLVTSHVKNINHFNFYFTGFLSPMFFFSGVIFSIGDLPRYLRVVSELLPLTHTVRIVRSCCSENVSPIIIWDFAYVAIFTVIVGWLAIRRLRKRLVN
ncbi:MAG: ABC transporter permease [Victivallales bacterium]|jgi:lipooligosaccharide transport system permease protein